MDSPPADSILFYNVENLFPADVPSPGRGQTGTSGLPRWDAYKFGQKISKIAGVFGMVQAQYGALPLFAGLSEVHGRGVVEDLVDAEVFAGKYGIIHYDSMDERGVDVALIYDKTRVEVLHSEPITYFFENQDTAFQNFDTTRDVLYCRLKIAETEVHVMVLHLPSKRIGDVNKPKRDYILADVAARIAALQAPVIICGDFNENPDEDNLQQLCGGTSPMLRNPFLQLYSEKKYSTFHQADGLLFDQIMLSNHFFSGTVPLQFSGAEVFSPPALRSTDAGYTNRPARTYAGSRYLGGYSDHFPVLVRLNFSTSI